MTSAPGQARASSSAHSSSACAIASACAAPSACASLLLPAPRRGRRQNTTSTGSASSALHDGRHAHPAGGAHRDQSALGARIAREDLGERAHDTRAGGGERSEEHTSELQSQSNLVCRLLLEK